ncbi:unnamed protein product [Lathyrus oleraceus]
MTKIIKVVIIFLSLFLIATNGDYSSTIRCRKKKDCPEDLCMFGFIQICKSGYCNCVSGLPVKLFNSVN